MTIAVSVRTATAVVFATDSKLTTSGWIGLDTAGKPIIVRQTYDNATKIVSLPAGSDAMGAVAGSVNLGPISGDGLLRDVGSCP